MPLACLVTIFDLRARIFDQLILRPADFKSQFIGVLEMVVHLSVIQQDFRGNAPDVQAGPTEVGIFFDNNCLQTQFSGANCRYVSAGPASNDCNIVFCHALSPFNGPGIFIGWSFQAR